jgi:hypothetical protein
MDIPTSSLDNPAARHVLLCMANYAGPEGRGAFPSAATISKQTGLSERTVRLKLDELEKAGWIAEGNQAIAAAYIDRRDRRPVVYDLQLKRGANAAPRKDRGADDRTGCSSQPNGVQENAERGAAAAPNTPLNHQGTEEQQPREGSDLIGRQDQQAIDDLDNRQRYAMFAEWSPNSRYLIAQAQIAGVKPTEIPDSVVKSFMGFFAAKPDTVDSAAGWCRRLVSWFVRERAATAVSGTGPDEIEDDSTDWMRQVPK